MNPPEQPLRQQVVRMVVMAFLLTGLLWLLGARPRGRVAVIVFTFTLVIWGGFVLAQGLLRPAASLGGSPRRAALLSTATMTGAYTLLMVLATFLVRLLTGVNLAASATQALTCYVIGFVVTVTVNGYHLTEHLVSSERERAAAELEALRLEEERLRQARELEAARDLQLGLLPAARPSIPGVDLAWAMRTATEVGGDWYDLRQAEDGAWLGAFGDATGHGLKAGLVGVAVKGLFQTGSGEPREDLARAGRGIRGLGLPNSAMALALWRLEARRLRVASAGLPPPLHYRAATGAVEALPLKAPPVGQLTRPLLPVTELVLEAGDALLFYTDGLPECLDPGGRMLGYGEVPGCFQGLATGSADAIVAGLLARAEGWAAGHPLEDDLTLLVLKVPSA